MHAHKISVLSNIQFKLSLLFTFSVLTTIITQEIFFFPAESIHVMWCWCYYQSNSCLLYAMFQSLVSIVPFVPSSVEWAFSTTADSGFVSRNSQSDSSRI